jgi:hypothetical protein
MKRAARPARTCDAPGCSIEVRRGVLMCRPHWYQTPRLLRETISEAWRAKRFRDWSAACLEARRWHRDNNPAALAARITGESL